MNSIHEIHGLDHKCRSCGCSYADHSSELKCLDDSGREYNPKGPQIPTALRILIEEFEDAAIAIYSVQKTVYNNGDYDLMKPAKDDYKRARFNLLAQLQILVQNK